jgi:hypothetical protein
MTMANLYGFGKVAWNPSLTSDQIIDLWTRLTFGNDRKSSRPSTLSSSTPGAYASSTELGRFSSGALHISGCERDSVRGGGFECVHVAIDDHSRIARATIQPNELAGSAYASRPCSPITDPAITHASSPRHAPPSLTPHAKNWHRPHASFKHQTPSADRVWIAITC